MSEKSTKFMKFLFPFARILQQGQSKTVNRFKKIPCRAKNFLDRDPRTFFKKSGVDTTEADFKDTKPLHSVIILS